MSFLERLKGKGVWIDAYDDTVPLDVDALHTPDFITLYARVAGAEVARMHVSLEGEANVVRLEGTCTRPEYDASIVAQKGAFFLEECAWGVFRRKISLPAPVDITLSEAKVKNGVLILTLPVLGATTKKKRKPAARAPRKVRVARTT